jgi:hypothetical protein
MRVAIMQPYFLPYIGYWQLIHAVDKFVILDDVNYINRGWINRNRILVNGRPSWLTIPLSAASQNKLILDLSVLPDDGWKDKMRAKVEYAYGKAANFHLTKTFFNHILDEAEGNLSDFLTKSIIKICALFGLTTEIIPSSRIFEKGELRGQDRIIDICKKMGANEYLNPSGGREIYSHAEFNQCGIQLFFLSPGISLEKLQVSDGADENFSILELLMHNDKNMIKNRLANSNLAQ